MGVSFVVGVTFMGNSPLLMFSSHSGAHHIEDASTPMEEDCPPLLQHKMLE